MKIYKLTISQEARRSSYILPRNETTEYYSTRALAEQRQKEIKSCVKTLNMYGIHPHIIIVEILVIESFDNNRITLGRHFHESR